MKVTDIITRMSSLIPFYCSNLGTSPSNVLLGEIKKNILGQVVSRHCNISHNNDDADDNNNDNKCHHAKRNSVFMCNFRVIHRILYILFANVTLVTFEFLRYSNK